MTTQANQIFPEPFTRLLLVEGDDDKAFFLSLAKHLDIQSEIYIYNYDGRDKLDDALITLVNDPRFELLKHIGIVRDADFNTDAFSSVRSRLLRANRINPRHQLPVPVRVMESAGDELKLSVLILPDKVEGMLENLVLNAFRDDPAMECVDQYFACLQDLGITFKQVIDPKARTRVFLSAKAVDDRYDHRTAEAWELAYIFRLEWWSWNSPVFDIAKAFLRQLVTA